VNETRAVQSRGSVSSGAVDTYADTVKPPAGHKEESRSITAPIESLPVYLSHFHQSEVPVAEMDPLSTSFHFDLGTA